jgi:hypothetical protein
MKKLAALCALSFLVLPVTPARAVCVFGFFGSDCETKIEVGDIKGAAEEIAKGLEGASENLEEALTKFDSLGLKKLIDENENLRLALDRMSGQLSRMPSYEPVIMLQDQKVVLLLTNNTGQFRVNAWIDDRDNAIFDDRMVYDPKPPVIDFASDDGVTEACLTNIDQFAGTVGWGAFTPEVQRQGCSVTIAATRAGVLAALKYGQGKAIAIADSLRNNNLAGSAMPIEMTTNQLLGSLGKHRIFIEVSPMKANAAGGWALRGELQLVAPSGARETLRTFDVHSEFTPDHKLGTPLPLKTFAVEVQKPS